MEKAGEEETMTLTGPCGGLSLGTILCSAWLNSVNHLISPLYIPGNWGTGVLK